MKKLLILLLAVVLALSTFVACDNTPDVPDEDNAVEYDLDSAVAYVEGLYKEDLSVTAVDYTVVSQVMIGGVTYQIDWSVDSEKVTVSEPANNLVTIGVDEKSPEEVQYKLTATVKAGDGTSKTVTFKLSVPKYSVNSHAEYMAAVQDDMLTIEGIVVAINSKDAGNKYNHLFLADANVTGGYYCYSITQDPIKDLGIQVGMTVKVTGPMAPYSGMQEIKGGQVAIVDSTIKTVEPVDITEAFAAGENLGVYVGLPVVIKGVDIGAQDLEKDTSQYLYFSIGEQQGYVRTYVTDFPTTLKADDKAAIDTDHADHFGYKADATGILILYNGAPYLIPMSTTPFTNYEMVTKTPEEKIAAEFDNLKVDSTFSSDCEVALPVAGTYYSEVTFTWASNNEAIVIADGKATVTVPDETVVVTLTATAACEGATVTKEYTVKLSKALTSIPAVIEIAKGLTDKGDPTADKYLVAGIVTEIKNTTYGNLYIQDSQGNKLYIYGLYDGAGARFDAMEKQPAVGDYIVVMSVIGHYNEPQLKNAVIVNHVTANTISEAIEIGNGFEKNSYTEEKHMITGTITELQNDKYGNVIIKDADGSSILVYGLYNDDGSVRYDALETKPVVGDTITVLGVLGKYNDAQMKNGWLIGHTVASAEGDATETEKETEEKVEVGELPAADSTLTIEQAIAFGTAMEHNTFTEGKYIVTGVITEVYNTQYGNMKLKDDKGNILTIYGTFDATGANRYDAMTVQPVAGDTVTIYGILGQYNGNAQIKNGWITEHVPAGN